MIKFTKLRFKNFGSFGNNFTEIDFGKKGNYLVSGKNGDGKSFAFLDAITFGLFGVPFRNINIPQLVNSINKKNCVVEVEFDIGMTKYLVRRGLSPKIFEIHKDGKLIEQAAKTKEYQEYLEKSILKMGYKSFTQVVILGKSSFVPFMQLSAADRREVIENVLDIGIFSSMNLVLKGKISQQKEFIKQKKTDLSTIQGKVDVLDKNKQDLEKKKQDIESKLQNRLKEIDLLILENNTITEQLETELEAKEAVLATFAETKLTSLLELRSSLKANLEALTEDVDFYEKNKVCPACKQDITDGHRTEICSTKNAKKNEIDSAIEKINTMVQEQKAIETSKRNVEKEISTIKNDLRQLKQTITNLEDQKKIYEKEAKIDLVDTIEKITNDISLLKKEAKACQRSLDTLYIENEDLEILSGLLKDSGIKTKIIRHYLPLMNQIVNKYLSNMNFFVHFYLDDEFKETIKSRHRDDFSYMSFSEGEKLRIDLALLLAWREVAKQKNSVSCNLLILDEVFDSSLDSVGTDELMKILNILGKETNVIVISHKTDQLTDKFKYIYTLEKKNNFSKISLT
jgi:DNA repair exonuclease SbcCD ATPase subunit